MKLTCGLAVTLCALLSGLGSAAAQAYPSGPIRWLVGFAAGGTADMISRDIGSELEKVLGQPVIVENRSGANGATATQALVGAKPDGQTLMMILSGHITNAFLYPNLGFDPLRDVVPISLVASSPLAIVANPNVAFSDIKSLVEAAKAKPNTISYATPGVASIQQLSLELMAFMTGTKFVHVPYRGGAPALNDVIGGHVPLAVLSVLQVMPQVEAKQLKPLAVTSKSRTDVWPDVPSISESGVPGYEAELWFGVIAPPGTPDAIVDRLNKEIARFIKSDAMQKRLASQGARAIGSSREEFAAFMRAEQDKWAKVLKEIQIKPE
ncbi:MAG: tripartite tricarboxylate transporter substrate binding protein [Alphaproteobacteria bacterium]|nr:MAG: tripartite tricarboxylate transporter substrate binding protein [Alphaproteobacteria bacterium]